MFLLSSALALVACGSDDNNGALKETCAVETLSFGTPSSGVADAGLSTPETGHLRVKNAAACGLSELLSASDSATSGQSPLAKNCTSLCCDLGKATSCAGTLVHCEAEGADGVACRAYGY